jgi:hypothetical protein
MSYLTVSSRTLTQARARPVKAEIHHRAPESTEKNQELISADSAFPMMRAAKNYFHAAWRGASGMSV